MQQFTAAVAILPDDGALWLELARAVLAVHGAEQPGNRDPAAATPPRPPGTPISCCAPPRRAPKRSPCIAVGLDRRDLFRPALQAYEASLALVNSASVRAEYEDLKARKGFRVVEHTRRCRYRLAARLRPVLRGSGQGRRRLRALRDRRRRGAEGRRGQGPARSASRAWSTASTTASPSAPACRRRSARCWQRRSCCRSTSRTARRRCASPATASCCPRTRAPRHPGRHRQHGRRRHEALPHRRPLAGPAAVRLPVPAPARRLRHRAPSPTSSASRSGRASSTSPTSSTRKSPPASRSTRRCPTASPASMC